jgi:hypothetical protein
VSEDSRAAACVVLGCQARGLGGEDVIIVAPLWVFLILFAIAGIITLIFGPRWKKEAEDRKRLFEERKREDGSEG